MGCCCRAPPGVDAPRPNPEISLERTSTKPLFAQVAQSLSAAIASGDFRPGQQIPTEPEPATTYGVSRITIRRAIEELCQHGLLIKRQGKGTFVRESKTARKIAHISSFSESCRASSMVPSAEVLRRELLDSPPPDAPPRLVGLVDPDSTAAARRSSSAPVSSTASSAFGKKYSTHPSASAMSSRPAPARLGTMSAHTVIPVAFARRNSEAIRPPEISRLLNIDPKARILAEPSSPSRRGRPSA